MSFPLLEVARSSFPSPLKSAATTPDGAGPVVKLPVATKVPKPVAKKTLTVLELSLETTMSRTPSPLTSAIKTPSGKLPAVTGKAEGTEKAPAPTFSRTLIVSLPLLVTTKSGRPSPFKSPIATSDGPLPTA